MKRATMKKKLIPIAKSLRKRMTDAEIKLWRHLYRKQPGIRFRRQRTIGNYMVDLVSFEAGVVIALDGSQHLSSQQH
ncbi:DUF559 domain-containing protein [bacterium]|nr:DUF559 domain-containing protein [bacterium]